MKYLLSYLEVPLEFQMKKPDNCKLKNNMFLTAEPLYKTIELEFEKIIDIVKSDHRQYSPFVFEGGKKIGDNWRNDNQNLLILDIDDGLSLNEAKELFKEFKYLIATTKSHQIEKKGLKCDRFRVILPAVNVPTGKRYFEFTSALEKKYPFIDKQVNIETGAFLGYFDCEYFYNNGNIFDCKPLCDAASKLKRAVMEETSTKQTKQISYDSSVDIDVQSVKDRLTREIVADIVSSCGYEVNRKFMFKYRQDERTPSAGISPKLLIKDFGSDLSTDAIGFVMETKQMKFVEAVNYVGSFVGVA